MTLVAIVGQTFPLRVELESQAAAGTFQSSPTVAAGDVKLLILPASPAGTEAYANSTNAPTVLNGVTAQVVIAAAETTAAGDGGEIIAVWADAAGDEWYSVAVHLQVKAADLPDTSDVPTSSANATAAAAAILVTPTNKLATAATGEASANVTMSAGIALGGRLAEVTDLPSQPLDATATQAAAAAAIGAYDPPTKAELDAGLLALVGTDGDTLESLSDQLDGIPTTGAAGAGAIAHTITVDDGVNPLDGAEVWISTDEAGSNVVAGTLSTDALGQVTFMLDAGTYWKHVQLAGYNFTATAFTVA